MKRKTISKKREGPIEREIIIERGNKLAIYILILVLVIVATVLLFIIPFPYTPTEEYMVIEPYTYIESYYEDMPYTTTKCSDVNAVYKIKYASSKSVCINEECSSYSSYCVSKNFWGNCVRYAESCSSYKCTKYRKECQIEIENKERSNVYFKIKLLKWDYDESNSRLIKKYDFWISALDKKYINWDFTYLPTDSVGCHYSVENYPSKRECKEIIKYKKEKRIREVVGTKEVEKTRKITMYSSLFNIWTGNVEWYVEN